MWVIVIKQNFNQNFNLIVDAACLPDQRQSISRNLSLKNPAKYWRESTLNHTYCILVILIARFNSWEIQVFLSKYSFVLVVYIFNSISGNLIVSCKTLPSSSL